MCRAVSEAAMESLHTNDRSIQKEILKVEIQNYGPFCLNKDQYGALNPELFQKNGLRLVDPNDLRFPEPPVSSETMEYHLAIPIRTVVYIVMTAPLGSDLRKHFPHLDEYKALDKVNEHWSDDKHVGVHRSMNSTNDDILQPTIGLQVDLSYDTGQTGLSAVSRWDSAYIDTVKMLELLDVCNVQHKARLSIEDYQVDHQVRRCSLETDPEPLPAGFRVIDTCNLCVVDLPVKSLQSYVALSYTWGGATGAKELQLERSNCHELYERGCLKKLCGIPELILDAINFCASMGERYLWVDRLCIVQDDLESKMHQINAMDRIYYMASFTLIAAVPLGVGLPGVAGRPRKSPVLNYSRRFHPKFRFVADNFMSAVLSSFWNTRGWTYQERILSRRAIYITEWQAYWICNRHSSQEEIGEIMASYNPWDLHKFSMYAVTVAEYTSRNLTFESDILNAFAGIGSQFTKKMGKPLLHGLPERYFSKALLWEQAKDVQKREDTLSIPTWSWAAWRGRSQYELNSRAEKLRVGMLVRFYVFDRDIGLRRIVEDEVWFFKAVHLDTLDTLPVIDPLYPEMRFMPSSEDSENAWRASVQNPWTAALKDANNSIETTEIYHPGTLAFQTTSAFVRLRMPTSLTYSPSPGHTKLDICSHKGTIVGQLAQLTDLWIDQNINLDEEQEVVVLAGGIASEAARYAQTHHTLHVSGEVQGPRTGDSLWYLHVMLITRDERDIASRVAIGTVELVLWNGCEPKWCTVILA